MSSGSESPSFASSDSDSFDNVDLDTVEDVPTPQPAARLAVTDTTANNPVQSATTAPATRSDTIAISASAICGNCGTTKSPNWRKNVPCTAHGTRYEGVLCGACGTRYSRRGNFKKLRSNGQEITTSGQNKTLNSQEMSTKTPPARTPPVGTPPNHNGLYDEDFAPPMPPSPIRERTRTSALEEELKRWEALRDRTVRDCKWCGVPNTDEHLIGKHGITEAQELVEARKRIKLLETKVAASREFFENPPWL